MRELKLSCPFASYGEGMRIRCSRADDGPCGFQYFKRCKGWWAESPGAAGCRLRMQSTAGKGGKA